MTEPVIDTLTVWWNERIAGVLSIDRGGGMHFTYAPEWLVDENAPPLSQVLPKQSEPFGDRLCKAVFGGLLPEEGQRRAIAQALGVSPDNPFRLLAALGGDVAGALAFLPAGETPPAQVNEVPHEPLNTHALGELLERLPRVPMLAGEGGARLSLAGAQSKLPVVVTGAGGLAVPHPGEPSTHLIKPEPERFPGLAANEAFCLALARQIGLDVAGAEWRMPAGKPLLLVTRYDRHLRVNGPDKGTTVRLHQEDFAQALGVPSNRKYASEGGPVFQDCFALLRRAATRPAREVLKLADAAIFNVIIGNADAHAKNFSLLRRADGEVVFAPLYDLVSTHMWPELSPRFAMRFGGATRLEEIDRDSLGRFTEQSGLTAPFLRGRVGVLAGAVQNAVAQGVQVPGLVDTAMIGTLASATSDRAERLALKIG